MRVALVNLHKQHASIQSEVLEAVGRVIEAQTFILGPEVAAFESEVASRLGVALRAIDQGRLRLSYTTESGDTLDLAKEGRGELAAQYMANDGWRAKYSKERVNDDVADTSSA